MEEREMHSHLRLRDRLRQPRPAVTRPETAVPSASVASVASAVWISGFNVPGFLPDTDSPPVATDWAAAWDGLLDEIQGARDQEEDPVSDAALLHAYAVAILATPGESFDFTTTTADGIHIAWWIMPVSP